MPLRVDASSAKKLAPFLDNGGRSYGMRTDMTEAPQRRWTAWVAAGVAAAILGTSATAKAADAAPAEGAPAESSTAEAAPVEAAPPAGPAPSRAPSFADAAQPDEAQPAAEPRDVKAGIPNLAYAYQATGAPARTMGVQAYGLGLVGGGGGQKAVAGGGVTMWGSPIDRLTLIGDASRDAFGQFAPSAAAVVRLVGRANDGWSLGAIGKYKIEGFGVGPNDEIESELESGLLVSYARYGWHLDANAITGFGLGDDGEIDVEGRLRLGRDVASLLRVGLDGQARVRAAGDTKLVGGRTWDFAGGPQLLVGASRFFGALTAGPATMGVETRVGFTALATVGGST